MQVQELAVREERDAAPGLKGALLRAYSRVLRPYIALVARKGGCDAGPGPGADRDPGMDISSTGLSPGEARLVDAMAAYYTRYYRGDLGLPDWQDRVAKRLGETGPWSARDLTLVGEALLNAEDYFRHSGYWQSWRSVPPETVDLEYALAAVAGACLPPGPSARGVLDVACGHGRLLRALRERLGGGVALYGVDINAEMVALSARACPGARVQQASAYHLPFTDRAVAVALCHEAMMHLDRPAAAVAEICRVAADRVYFSVTTHWQLATLGRRLGWLPRRDPRVPHWDYDLEVVRRWLPAGWRWRLVGADLIGRKPLRLSHRAHRRVHAVERHLPQWLLRRLGQAVYVYGERQ